MLYKMTCNGFLKSFGYLELFSDFFFNNFLCSTDSEEGICLSISLCLSVHLPVRLSVHLSVYVSRISQKVMHRFKQNFGKCLSAFIQVVLLTTMCQPA